MSASHMACASLIRAKLSVLTFLSGLSNRIMATPAGVSSTFWKYLYLRSGDGTNGVSSSLAADAAAGGDGFETGSSSWIAAAALEKYFVGRKGTSSNHYCYGMDATSPPLVVFS